MQPANLQTKRDEGYTQTTCSLPFLLLLFLLLLGFFTSLQAFPLVSHCFLWRKTRHSQISNCYGTVSVLMFSLCGRHPHAPVVGGTPCTSGGRHPHASVVGGTPMHQWWEAPPCTGDGRHPNAPVVGGTPMHQWWEAPQCTSGGGHPHAPVVGGDYTSAAPPIQLPSQLVVSYFLECSLSLTFSYITDGDSVG